MKKNNFVKLFCLNLIFMCFVYTVMASEMAHKPKIGLGYSNNIYYVDTGQKKDSFIFFQDYLSQPYKDYLFSFFVRYKDFFNYSDNDVFNWSLNSNWPIMLLRGEDTEFNLNVGGQNYVNGAPGQTEDSFNYVFLESSILYSKQLEAGRFVMLEPGLILRKYNQFSDRRDFGFYVIGTIDFTINAHQLLSPYAEVGAMRSSDGLYSNRYLELGAQWLHKKIIADYKLGAKINLRSTAFPDRTLSQRTVISDRRGRTISGASREIETERQSQLSILLGRTIDRFEFDGNLSFSGQVSKSGVSDYSEMSAMASASYSF